MVVILTTIVHFRFVQAKCVLELIFYWNCSLLVIYWIRQTEELNRLFFILYIRNTFHICSDQNETSYYYTVQFDAFHIKTQHLFIEYQKHISKIFDNYNHIFCSKRIAPHPLWSVLLTVNYTKYNVIYSSIFTVIIDSLCQPFELILSFGFPVCILSDLKFPGLISSVILVTFINLIQNVSLFIPNHLLFRSFSTHYFRSCTFKHSFHIIIFFCT
jgi:hypothetical protein